MSGLDHLAPRWPEISRLLDEALALPAPQWDDWLASRTPPDLAPTLRTLLGARARAETAGFLAAVPRLAQWTEPVSDADGWSPGSAVGPYRLVHEIGRGGMGMVWLAERSDGGLQRRVALKLPLVVQRRSVLAQRFARERDILAALEHPNIARLYDAGVDDGGQPYLALEYVDGQTITAYCNEHGLGVDERISLLRQVMDAVQYAHAHLVVHRDIKPSNVLVTTGRRSMLLDFGIAKLLQEDEPAAAATELTRVGGQALTVEYAAPEQLSGAAISIATDVHALGVLLYELLAGVRPFTGRTRAQVESAILEAEPARPSQSRRGVQRLLSRSAAADLDTIVLKALKKAPADRYTTVSAMAEDLDRYLRNEPVLARPDTHWYRWRKFVVRHRLPVGVGAASFVALAALSAMAGMQAREAARQAAAARQETQRAHTVQEFLLDLFRAGGNEQDDPAAMRELTARDLIDRGAQRVDEALRDQPESRFEVMRTLADLYWQLDLREQAAEIEHRRVGVARQLHGPGGAPLAKVFVDYAETILDTPRQTEIPSLVDEAVAVLEAAGDPTSEVRGQALVVLSGYLQHVSYQGALDAADAAVAFLERHHPRSDRMIEALVNAARMRIHGGHYRDAVSLAERAAAAARRVAPNRGWLRQPLITLADAHAAQLGFEPAEQHMRAELALAREYMGERSVITLISMARLGVLLQEVGRCAEGDALHRTVREALTDPALGRHRSGPFAAGILGLRMLERGRPDLLEPALRAEIDALRAGIFNPPLRASRQRLSALVQSAAGRHEQARLELDTARALWDGFTGATRVPVVDSLLTITRAQLENAAGQPATALDLLDRTPPVGPRLTLAHGLERARALVALRRDDEAAAAAAAVVASLSARPPGQRPIAMEADARLVLGRALSRRDPALARQELRQAVQLRRDHDLPGSLWLSQAEAALAAVRRR